LLSLSCVYVTPLWADEVTASDAAIEEEMFFADMPSVFIASKHEQAVTRAPPQGSLYAEFKDSRTHETEIFSRYSRRCQPGV
jgi:hypothetical protein